MKTLFEGILMSLLFGVMFIGFLQKQEIVNTVHSEELPESYSKKEESHDMTTEETLKNIYRQVNQAMVDKDTTTLESLLGKDTLLVHMTGYQQPVSEWLDQIVSEEMRYYSWQEEAIKDIQIEGKQASLVGQSRVKARIWGSGPSTWSLQIKMYLEYIDGQWVITKQVASTY